MQTENAELQAARPCNSVKTPILDTTRYLGVIDIDRDASQRDSGIRFRHMNNKELHRISYTRFHAHISCWNTIYPNHLCHLTSSWEASRYLQPILACIQKASKWHRLGVAPVQPHMTFGLIQSPHQLSLCSKPLPRHHSATMSTKKTILPRPLKHISPTWQAKKMPSS